MFCGCATKAEAAKPPLEAIMLSLLYFHDRLDLDGVISRKRLHSHCAAGVYARLSKNLNHQIGKAVDNQRGLSKSLNGVDIADHFSHALYAIQAP